jgi:lysophospholipase L1-like esterase
MTPLITLKHDDRIAWIGSSSTVIGVWPKTVEFLLRTRHPDLNLTFHRVGRNGGTFATALPSLEEWLKESQPTVVVFNYGGNDAARGGSKGVNAFLQDVEKAVEQTRSIGARVLLMTSQPSDDLTDTASQSLAELRKEYALALIKTARQKGWPIFDAFGRLTALRQQAKRDTSHSFKLHKDRVHLSDAAYVAWGFYLYKALRVKPAVSLAELTGDGRVRWTEGCRILDMLSDKDRLTFRRIDSVLPVLPPVPLPPHLVTSLELELSYRLRIRGLRPARYDIMCNGNRIANVDAAMLERGVNLNTLSLDTGLSTPWDDAVRAVWAGKPVDFPNKTRWNILRIPAA